jgi:hypothetical protein
MLAKGDLNTNAVGANGTRWGYAGVGIHGADASADVDVAYLHIKDMFRFGGDFTFGRNFYATGHSLLLSDYVDAVKYYKRSGDIDIGFMSIFDSHIGSNKDDAPAVNYKNIWALTLGTKYHDHDLYLNFFTQQDPNLTSTGRGIVPLTRRVAPIFGMATPVILAAAPAAASFKTDQMWDVEFGGKGPLGKNGHWDYDLGLVYSAYTVDLYKPAAFVGCDLNGWAGHGAIKWDSKKEWAAKLGYTFATDEFAGPIALDNDRRYDDGIETPYEDIARGNNYFAQGLLNMYDMKLQVEYRPRNTKHYFRLAGDFLAELKDTVSNHVAQYNAGEPGVAQSSTTGNSKTNTAYDRYNNFGTSDAKANVLTFEYRYQLAENTRIRIGYTAFDMYGDATKAVGAAPSVAAGRGAIAGNDWKYNMFWAELYSRF